MSDTKYVQNTRCILLFWGPTTVCWDNRQNVPAQINVDRKPEDCNSFGSSDMACLNKLFMRKQGYAHERLDLFLVDELSQGYSSTTYSIATH